MRTHGVMWWLGLMAVSALSISAVVQGQEGAKLESLEQYTRLQIPITGGSTFRLRNAKAGEATLVVDRVATGALDNLPSLQDGRVQEVRVKNLGLDQAEITVRFREAGTESFAYQQGNTLVLDLWHGAAQKAAAPAAAPARPTALPKAVKKVAKAEKSAKTARKPASQTAAAKVALAATPAVEPLKIDRDLFLKFLLPMPELTIKAKDGGFDLPPEFSLEGRWKFSQGDKETEDGRGFEFAKSLFQAKKYGLCLKTIEITLRDHPNAEDADEMAFLRALAYRKLGEANKADVLIARSDKMLEELAARRDEEGKPLPFGRLIVLSFATKHLAAGEWLEALQKLEYVSSITPAKEPDFPYVQMLLAETYAQVKQPRRAERLYRFLVEKFPRHPLAREAYYRIADLLANEKNYGRVTEEGEAALKAYPDYEKKRAEVLFQIGEAYFWRADYASAEKYFRRFVNVASAQTISSLAWVRLGEIEEVSRHDLKAAHADYMKAKNGYPFSKGDLVATVRLARIDLPAEKEPDFVVRTLKELLLDKTVESELKRMAELTLADYMLVTGDIDDAIAIARGGMAETDGLVYNLYKRAYEKGLYARLAYLADHKKYSEALALYEHERKWLESYGPDTLRTLAEVYRGLGLFASANQMMERYRTAATQQGRMPASAHAEFNREKAANSFARGAYQETLAEVEGHQDALSTYYRAVSEFRLGHKAAAYAAADRAMALVKANPTGFNDAQVEEIAEIQIERDDVERDYPRMEREVVAARALCQKDNDRLAYAGADALWYQKRHKEAVAAYRSAREKFPQSSRRERSLYNEGMSLVALGKREDAVKVLTDLRNSGQSVWSESAKQELELIEWERKYSSVLRTLPPSGLGIAN